VENFKLPTYPVSRLPSLSAHRRSFLFDRPPVSGRFVASSGIAIHRTAIHLLARLTIAATCTSSAAEFDAMHTSRMTVATAGGSHSLEPGRGSPARPESASQREVEVQSGEPEEMGKLTGRARAHAQPTGQLRSGECYSLLMPDADPLNLAAANRVAQQVEGITDQAEDLPNPDLFEHADQDVCDHLSHLSLLRK
jgi:hypothetical protein